MVSKEALKSIRDTLAGLRNERSELDAQIELLEETIRKLGGGRAAPAEKAGKKKAPRNGRAASGAAKKVKAAPAAGAPKRKKPHWSPDARKAAAERMRKFWAERKKKPAAS
jgi:hypothetical protein